MLEEKMISIIIPLYNKATCIRKTVEAILGQPYNNIELIVVDDGSTDNSVSKLEGLTDHRLKILKKSNGGPSSARNLGVKYASSQWIYFIDADDIIENKIFLHFSELIQLYPDINVFVANYFMKKGKIFKKHTIYMNNGVVKNNFRSWFWEVLSPCQGAVLYRKSLLEKFPYPENLRRWEDASMFFQIMRNEKIFMVDIPAFTYNLDDASASHCLKNIENDFLGHLDFKNNMFWEKMAYMLLYKQAVKFYPLQANKLYGKHPFKISDEIFFGLLSKIKLGMRIIAKIKNIISKP